VAQAARAKARSKQRVKSANATDRYRIFGDMRSILFVFLAVAVAYGIRWWYLKPKYAAGESVAEVQHTLIGGEPFLLSSLSGNYVLLHFWGSWCGPCRHENPQIVELYNNFKDSRFSDAEGFKIVSMGVENSETSWKKAIAKDHLAWPHHIGQFDRFDSSMAKVFGVREIPTLYLLGPGQKVLMVNPTPAEISSFLSEKKDV